MALAIYHEADRVKPSANEKLLIGWAVKNRLGIGFRPGNLPAAKNLCEVVWAGLQKNPQFSWTVSGEAFKIKYKREFYIAFAAAHMVYVGSPEALRLRDEVGAVDLFHADYVSPDWADNVTFAGKFGRHLFYLEEDRHEKGRESMDANIAWQVAMLEGPLR
jgi:spore germination cell wall hydrolase CwlJ-like protein